MGGCKCTFRSCNNTSAAVPGLHFFHYPVKYPARLQLWLENAQTQRFASLPDAKLKNKVVCQYHFKPECFMNFKQDSLTKTAVPTEWIQGTGNDHLRIPDPKETEPPRKVLITDCLKYIGAVPVEDYTPKAPSKTTVRLINQSLLVQESIKEDDKDLPSLVSVDEEEETVPHQRRQHSEKELTGKLFQEYSKHLEEQKEMMVSQAHQIQDIKSMLQDLSNACMPAKEDPPRLPASASATNKRNLFNALKRHINPVMATLLGMELFGSPDHEWREDEKDLAMELHSQGEPVYKFFRDDLRFRLPAIADVESWRKKDSSH